MALMEPQELTSPAATMPLELPLEPLALPLKEPPLLLLTDLVPMEQAASQAQESPAVPPMEQLELPEPPLTLLEELQLKVQPTVQLPEHMALLLEPTELHLVPMELQDLVSDILQLQEHHQSHLREHQGPLEPLEHQEALTLPILPITTGNE